MRRLPHMLMLLALVLSVLAPTAALAVGDVSDTINVRLPGGNNQPADIAIRFSGITFEDGDVDEVLLATEASFADALASGTLQGGGRPLLLTRADDLRADVASEIDRLGAERVTILGGESALTADVEEELTDVGLQVDRLAGATRFHTAVEVARLAPESSTAIVSRGFGASGDETQAFADALAAGAWAAEEGWPTFLTASDSLTEPTRAAIADSDISRVMLLGGPAAISEQVVVDLAGLGVTVERVSGETRFSTAIQVARQRGFDNAEDAERIVLVEGQAEDAWASGFAAAAYAAQTSSPIVLANGDALPPESIAFLEQTTFAVDENTIDEPVLVCAAAAAACDQARLLLGLPQEAFIVLDEPEDGAPSREALEGNIDLFGETAQVTAFGPCIPDGLVVPDADGFFSLDILADPGVCSIDFEVAFGNGTVQRQTIPVLVAAALPKVGPVVDTDTGRDAYTLVAAGDTSPRVVTYAEDDTFSVDGQDATIGAFEAALTVADQVTFRADTVDGDIHELVNIEPSQISDGTAGNVNLAEDTFAIIEPISGVALRPGIEIASYTTFTVDGDTTDADGVRAAINEGDEVSTTASRVSISNNAVLGTARDITVDAVSGVARLRVDTLGDDPLTSEDERFRARDGESNQLFTVDGDTSNFDGFVAALSIGDEVRYQRVAGTEQFLLNNRALPPVDGLVTETFDPDGSALAPEPADGGSLVLLSADGRLGVSYSADARFEIDGALATEAEFEAARSAGDRVTYQSGDAQTSTEESIALSSRDLTGSLDNISEGDNTFDIVTLSGVVYDDLDYTDAVFGGDDVYVINAQPQGLSQFEAELAAIDEGQVEAVIVVRRNADGDTEHLLTRIE